MDYLLIKFNYKFPQALDRLFPVARQHNVGLVAMKVFCWDCGPGQWGRRISVFEPTDAAGRTPDPAETLPAQESLRWVLEHPFISTMVPAMNAMWEVEQNLLAVDGTGAGADTTSFARYQNRLWDPVQLQDLALHAESETIRERAAALA